MCERQLLSPCRRQLELHVLHRLGDDLRSRQVAEPLVIRRDDVPRRMRGAGFRQGLFIRFDVFRPQLALRVVRLADLPVAGGIVEPLLEALELLLGADMQEELENARAVQCQQFLEVVDQLVAF